MPRQLRVFPSSTRSYQGIKRKRDSSAQCIEIPSVLNSSSTILSEMMVCRLLGPQPLSNTVPVHCKLGPCKHFFCEIYIKLQNKMPLNISSAKCWPLSVSILLSFPLNNDSGQPTDDGTFSPDKIQSRH